MDIYVVVVKDAFGDEVEYQLFRAHYLIFIVIPKKILGKCLKTIDKHIITMLEY